MPDRISNYRQIRLTITPSSVTTTTLWSASTIQVVKGVPHAHHLDGGHLDKTLMPATEEQAVMALMRVAWHLESRWMLYGDSE